MSNPGVIITASITTLLSACIGMTPKELDWRSPTSGCGQDLGLSFAPEPARAGL